MGRVWKHTWRGSMCLGFAALMSVMAVGTPTPGFTEKEARTLWLSRVRDFAEPMLAGGRAIETFRGMWTESELDAAFGDAESIPMLIWRITVYGPGFSAATAQPALDHLQLLVRTMGSHLASPVTHVQLVNVSTFSGGQPPECRGCEGLCEKGTQEMCRFDLATYGTATIDVHMNVTREKKYGKYKGWTARKAMSDALAATMDDLGFPGINFMDAAMTLVFVPSILFNERTLRDHMMPSMSFALSLQLTGPCAVPFTLEKETALRLAISELLRPLLNIYYTRVREVSECTFMNGTGSINLTIVLGSYTDYLQPTVKEALQQISDEGLGPSPLLEHLVLRGLTLTHARIVHVKILNGDPPETFEEWFAHQVRLLREAQRATDFRRRLRLFVTVLAGCSALAWLLYLGRKRVIGAIQKKLTVTSHDSVGSKRSTRTGEVLSDGPPSNSSIDSFGIQGANSVTKPQWLVGTIPNEELTLVLGPDGEPIQLGQGSSGAVYKGMHDGVHQVAIKIMSNAAAGSRKHQMFLKEVELLRSCRHSHIVQFQGVSFVGNDIWLVMEYAAGGDLLDALDGGTEYEWYGRGAQVALDIASGLAYLHTRNIIHLDIKTPNILLTEDGRAKVGDVGLAQLMTAWQTHATMQNLAGTFTYIAPEVLVEGRASCSADIYSYGIILWEIITGERPRRGCLRQPRVPEECPQGVADLIERCRLVDPKERPTAADIIIFMRNELGSRLDAKLSAESVSPTGLASSNSAGSSAAIAKQMCNRQAGALRSRASGCGDDLTAGLTGSPSGDGGDASAVPMAPPGFEMAPADEGEHLYLTFHHPFDEMISPFQMPVDVPPAWQTRPAGEGPGQDM